LKKIIEIVSYGYVGIKFDVSLIAYLKFQELSHF